MPDRRITDLPGPEHFVRFQPGFGQRFIVTVDAEEECDWRKPLRPSGHTLHAVSRLAKFQTFCEGQGVAPVYLVDHPIATSELAGDLLPGATTEQVLATAFHRNTMANDEGGTDDEEFRVAAVKDRVDTTGQVFMGLTVGCAKCHSHKFDPISQREYYQLFAIFNQTEDNDNPGDEPRLPTPTPAQLAQIQTLQEKIKTLASF